MSSLDTQSLVGRVMTVIGHGWGFVNIITPWFIYPGLIIFGCDLLVLPSLWEAVTAVHPQADSALSVEIKRSPSSSQSTNTTLSPAISLFLILTTRSSVLHLLSFFSTVFLLRMSGRVWDWCMCLCQGILMEENSFELWVYERDEKCVSSLCWSGHIC